MSRKSLIIGACGQIGSEITTALRELDGRDGVIASDIRESNQELVDSGPFIILDATNRKAIKDAIEEHQVTDVYLMAAILSAKAEQNPEHAWNLNMNSLFNVLELAKEGKFQKLFWPSSIAVFGPSTPRNNTPQTTIMEPTTVYGISKQAGERWCEYYHNNYGVDVRSLRYPGIISWRTLPGGGTTDYAVEIFHEAIENGSYKCFLRSDTELPMMFMDDAIKATLDIMNAESDDIKIRSSYNVAAVSFTPAELAECIKREMKHFSIEYEPDFRQKIADSWPNSLDDSEARNDWNWRHSYDLEAICKEMLTKLRKKELS